MEIKQAQAVILAAIKRDATLVVAQIIDFAPSARSIVAAAQAAPGTAAGVAASALKFALRGADNNETTANTIRFAETICPEAS